jgi:hypothetical protein
MNKEQLISLIDDTFSSICDYDTHMCHPTLSRQEEMIRDGIEEYTTSMLCVDIIEDGHIFEVNYSLFKYVHDIHPKDAKERDWNYEIVYIFSNGEIKNDCLAWDDTTYSKSLNHVICNSNYCWVDKEICKRIIIVKP